MKFKIHVDDAEHQVEAAADGTLTVDGQAFQVKVNSPSDDRRMVQVGDKSHEVRVAESGAEAGVYVLELAGERIPVTVTDVSKSVQTVGAAASRAANGNAGAPAAAGDANGGAVNGASGNGADTSAKVPDEVKEGVWAPVPGKIVDIFVKTGDTVEAGAPVLVLEAMKMENELHAPKKGVVAAVLVKKGDQADKGQLLVAFE